MGDGFFEIGIEYLGVGESWNSFWFRFIFLEYELLSLGCVGMFVFGASVSSRPDLSIAGIRMI